MSVRVSHATCFVTKPNNAQWIGLFSILIPHQRAITLVFWHQQLGNRVVGRPPLSSAICAQSETTPFEKRRLRQIFAYNVSTVWERKKFNYNEWEVDYGLSNDGVHTFTPKSPNGGSKGDFLFLFLIKFTFIEWSLLQSFFSFENSQRQCCSITTPLSKDP